MSSGAHLRGLPLERHSSEKTSQQWRAVGRKMSHLTSRKTQTFRIYSEVFNRYAHLPVEVMRAKYPP